jgi:protein-serine/threonine kinase
MQRFKEQYLISNRRLGSGAYGQVHMAVDQHTGCQLACKIIDLRGLKAQLHKIESLKTPGTETWHPAATVDLRAQLAKVKMWAKRKHQARYIEQKLRTYDREVEILQHLRHVR